MSLVKLVLGQQMDGHDVQNVFYYQYSPQFLDNVDLQELITQFIANVQGEIRNIQNEAVEHHYIHVTDLAGVNEETASFSPPLLGLRTGQYLPRFVSWTFKYNRASTVTRNGRKAFAGVSEDDQIDGVADGLFAVTLNTTASNLDTDLTTTTGGITFTPVIARNPGQVGEVTNLISNVSYQRISTQNSRK